MGPARRLTVWGRPGHAGSRCGGELELPDETSLLERLEEELVRVVDAGPLGDARVVVVVEVRLLANLASDPQKIIEEA